MFYSSVSLHFCDYCQLYWRFYLIIQELSYNLFTRSINIYLGPSFFCQIFYFANVFSSDRENTKILIFGCLFGIRLKIIRWTGTCCIAVCFCLSVAHGKKSCVWKGKNVTRLSECQPLPERLKIERTWPVSKTCTSLRTKKGIDMFLPVSGSLPPRRNEAETSHNSKVGRQRLLDI